MKAYIYRIQDSKSCYTKKYVVGCKLCETGTFKAIIRFHTGLLNYLATSISIKLDFEISLQIYGCDYNQISVMLYIRKKKQAYLSTHKYFCHFYAKCIILLKIFPVCDKTDEVFILLKHSTYSLIAEV